MAGLMSLYRLPYQRFDSETVSSLSRTFVALLYAALVVLIPWEQLLGSEYVDRASFLENLEVNLPLFELFSDRSLFFLALNEVLWDAAVRSIAALVGGYERAFIVVTCFCSFAISRFVFRHYFGIMSFLLLLNPILIDLVSSQLRFALATSLALLLYDKGGWAFRAGLLIVLASVHTAMILILPVLWYSELLADKLRGRPAWQPWIYILVPVGIALLVLGPAREYVLGSVGDRRTEYASARQGLGYVSVWVLYLVVVLLHGRKLFGHHIGIVAVFFVALFLAMNSAGLYGLRFLANVFPFFVVSMKFFDLNYRIPYQVAFLYYQFLQWLYWGKAI
jgi:hypothetical protein